MSGVIMKSSDRVQALGMLAQLRTDLGMPTGATLHFNQMAHSSRVHVTSTLGKQPYLTIANVIVCKRELALQIADLDAAYLLTLRYLLERISWYIDDRGGQAYVTFAHIDRFKVSKLDAYIALLQSSSTEIRWQALHLPVRMETMQANHFLQIADSTASGTAQAFEPDRFGNIERRFLEAMAPRLYRRPPGKLSSYGMKIHPTSAITLPAYAWVNSL